MRRMSNLVVIGFDDEATAFEMRAAPVTMQSQYLIETTGGSALFILVRKSTPDKVLEGLKAFAGKGRVLQTSLTKGKEEELSAFLEAK
jgi:uncharacterized membrane protein